MYLLFCSHLLNLIAGILLAVEQMRITNHEKYISQKGGFSFQTLCGIGIGAVTIAVEFKNESCV